jgi:tetratricopeptide (TPR) repeat protein
MRAMAAEALGYAFEAQGKLDEAKAAFAKLADEGAPQRAAFQQARLALVQGKPEARQALEQVAKDYPKDPVAMEAQQRVELSGLPPPPPPGTAAAEPAPPAAQEPVKKDAKAQKPIAKKK